MFYIAKAEQKQPFLSLKKNKIKQNKILSGILSEQTIKLFLLHFSFFFS